MKIEVNRKIIKTLYKTHCVYMNGTEDKEGLDGAMCCDKCILSEITYKAGGINITRDLCFGIWHDMLHASEKEKNEAGLFTVKKA